MFAMLTGRPRGSRSRMVLLPAALLLVALVALGSGCSRVSVRTMADPQIDFTRYATFAFAPDAGKPPLDAPPPRHLAIIKEPRYHASLQEVIGSTLVEKGFTPVRPGIDPDFLIAYHTVVRDQADVVPPLYGVGWRGHVYRTSPGYVRWYKEGTLVIDIVDTADNQLVWRGVGVGAMRDMHPGTPMTEAVQEILEQFPPH